MTPMNKEHREIDTGELRPEDARESGRPGGGQGRKDEVGGSGVQPVSLPHTTHPEAVIRGMAEWGQGERGAAGYQDHGESELRPVAPGAPLPQRTAEEEPVGEPEPEAQGEHKTQPAGALPSGLIRNPRYPTGQEVSKHDTNG